MDQLLAGGFGADEDVAWQGGAVPDHPGVVLGMTQLLDDLAFSLVVVDASCRLIYANGAGLREMSASRGLNLVGGRVVATDTGSQATLHADVSRAMSGRQAYRAYCASSNSTHVAFLPLFGADRTAVRAVALLLERPTLCDPLALYYFSRNHHLTEREQRVLGEVATGATVAEVAAALDMKLPTARTHVRHILEKTGRDSLRDLTARLAKLPPVAARDPGCGAFPCEVLAFMPEEATVAGSTLACA